MSLESFLNTPHPRKEFLAGGAKASVVIAEAISSISGRVANAAIIGMTESGVYLASHLPSDKRRLRNYTQGPAVHFQAAESDQEEPQIFAPYTGLELHAEFPTEPAFRFHAGGIGIYEIGLKWIEAIKNRTGKDPSPYFNRFLNLFHPDVLYKFTKNDGICGDIAAYLSQTRGPVPEVGVLGAGTEAETSVVKGNIITIGGLQSLGDADRIQTTFIHPMLENHLAWGQKFIVDFGQGAGIVFRTVSDMARFIAVEPSRRLQGWIRVVVEIRTADYLDAGHQRANGNYYWTKFEYEVNSLTQPGRIDSRSSSRPFRRFAIADAMLMTVTEADGSTGNRPIDADLTIEELRALKAIKGQGNAIPKYMWECFNEMAYPAIILDCTPTDYYCRT